MINLLFDRQTIDLVLSFGMLVTPIVLSMLYRG